MRSCAEAWKAYRLGAIVLRLPALAASDHGEHQMRRMLPIVMNAVHRDGRVLLAILRYD